MNSIKRSIETTLDISPVCPVSELEKLSHALTYINILSAKLDRDAGLSCEESTLPLLTEKLGAVPLLTVSCTFPETAHRLFTDNDTRESFLADLLVYLKTGGYRGVNFAFLRLFPFDRDIFTLFLKKCVEVLHNESYSVGIILTPPCALSLSAANDYEAQGQFPDRVNFLLSGCLYNKGCFQCRPNDVELSETLEFAKNTVPAGKLAVTIADHGLVPAGKGELQIVPMRLARIYPGAGAEFEDAQSYERLFEKIMTYGVSGISIRPYSRADEMIFDVLSENYDILRL